MISIVALIVAIGGGTFALAGGGTKQVKKVATKVVRKLEPTLSVDKAKTAKKAKVATKATTAANATGLAGALASDQTLVGKVGTGGHRDAATDFVSEGALSFPIPLAAAPTARVIPIGGPPTTNCPGSAGAPSAGPGQLCVYLTLVDGATGLTLNVDKYGAAYFADGVAAGANYEVQGVWAVKAP